MDHYDTMLVRTLLMRVCCVFCVCVRAGLCICVLEPHISAFVFLLCLLLLLLYHVCITPSLKLASSLLCGSHGTTAVAHEALPFVTATDGASAVSYTHLTLPTKA